MLSSTLIPNLSRPQLSYCNQGKLGGVRGWVGGYHCLQFMSTDNNHSFDCDHYLHLQSTTRQPKRRITTRDLIFYMEQERETRKSPLLYKSLLKWLPPFHPNSPLPLISDHSPDCFLFNHKVLFLYLHLITCYSRSFITAGSSIIADMHEALFILTFIFLQFENMIENWFELVNWMLCGVLVAIGWWWLSVVLWALPVSYGLCFSCTK